MIHLGLVFSILLPSHAAGEPSGGVPRSSFEAAVSELRAKPDDQALRERVIQAALALATAPKAPAEAKRRMARGKAAVAAAKDASGYAAAAAEFKAAVDAAPWLADAFYNLGVVQDKAGEHAAAIRSLRLYLLAAPKAEDAEEVEALIYEVEYRQEQAGNAATAVPLDPEVEKRKKFAEFLAASDGARWVDETNRWYRFWVELKGRRLVATRLSRDSGEAGEMFTADVDGPEFTFRYWGDANGPVRNGIIDERRIRVQAGEDSWQIFDRAR